MIICHESHIHTHRSIQRYNKLITSMMYVTTMHSNVMMTGINRASTGTKSTKIGSRVWPTFPSGFELIKGIFSGFHQGLQQTPRDPLLITLLLSSFNQPQAEWSNQQFLLYFNQFIMSLCSGPTSQLSNCRHSGYIFDGSTAGNFYE